jgi:uncharacterized radical SAM superfamily Fe-S cluster-containing enzyme
MRVVKMEKWPPKELPYTTKSICPECFCTIEATVYEEDGKVMIKKECTKHGEYKDVYWSSVEDFHRAFKWAYIGLGLENPRTETINKCPNDCGICPNHKSHTSLALLDVTNRCNLECPICVDGSETILIKNSQICKFTTIDEMMNAYMTLGTYEKICENVDCIDVGDLGIKVPALTNDGHIIWTNVKRIYRKNNLGKLLQVTTETGRSIRLTPDHKLFRWDGSELTKIRAHQIKLGDTILVANQLKLGKRREIQKLDVLELLRSAPTEDLKNIYVRGVLSYLNWIKKSKGLKFTELAEKVGTTWSYYWNINNTIPILVFYELTSKFGIPEDIKHQLTLGIKGKAYTVPAIIKVNEALARLIALFIAEGNFNIVPGSQYSIRITVKDIDHVANNLHELSWLTLKIIDYSKYGIPRKTPQINISGKIPCLLLRYGLKLGTSSSEKSLPEFVLSFPKETVRILLAELLSRDGYVSRPSRRTVVGYRTTSKRLVQQIQYLLSTFGVYARIKVTPSEKYFMAKHDCYDIQVSTKPELEKLLEFLPDESEVAEKLKKLLPKEGKITVERWEDTILDLVKDVREEAHEGFVYDLEVEAATHNFIINTIVVSNCFAHAGKAGYVYEPTQEEIREMMMNLRSNRPVPAPALQFAGGEPTVRKDLPELIKMAKEVGFPHVQIASNALLLAQKGYPKKLVEAGLSTVYMQFDGVTPEPYIAARGVNLLSQKLKALERCREEGLHSIVLVPTLVRGVNHEQVGDIIRFAVENNDIIRCVNFQPVSITGRIDYEKRQEMRITIPDLMQLAEEQTDGLIKRSDWFPVPFVVPLARALGEYSGKPAVEFSTHPACGMATFIVIEDDGSFVPITKYVEVEKFLGSLEKMSKDFEKGKRWRGKMRGLISAMRFFKKRGLLFNLANSFLRNKDYSSLSEFMKRIIMIGSMHFQDPYNLDLERLERCSIHYAVPDGRIVPFCSMNTLHREKIEKKFAIPIEEWKEKHPGAKMNAPA